MSVSERSVDTGMARDSADLIGVSSHRSKSSAALTRRIRPDALEGRVVTKRLDRRKRIFDIAVGTVLAVALSPLVIILAIAVAVSFRAWPFFVQERVGKDGRLFRFIKLRTLPPTAPAYADKYAISGIETTRLARVLRAKHLDELPQLLLVLAGKMSLVGPRPEMAMLHEQGDPAFAASRTTVRPGCAGLWQVSEHKDGLIWEAPQYDLAYVTHRSIAFDLWILWRTVLYTFHLRPAVGFRDIPSRLVPSPLVSVAAEPVGEMIDDASFVAIEVS